MRRQPGRSVSAQLKTVTLCIAWRELSGRGDPRRMENPSKELIASQANYRICCGGNSANNEESGTNVRDIYCSTTTKFSIYSTQLETRKTCYRKTI